MVCKDGYIVLESFKTVQIKKTDSCCAICYKIVAERTWYRFWWICLVVYSPQFYRKQSFHWTFLSPIQDGLFRCCSRTGEAKRPPSLKSVTRILQWWNLVHLYLTWRRSNIYIYKSSDTPPEFCWNQHFF